MASGTQKVLTQVLKLVDAHDLVRRGGGPGAGAGGRGQGAGMWRSATTVCTRAWGGESSLHRLLAARRGAVSAMRGAAPLPCPQPQYGSVAYPKHHTQQDISDIYLFAAVSPLRCA